MLEQNGNAVNGDSGRALGRQLSDTNSRRELIGGDTFDCGTLPSSPTLSADSRTTTTSTLTIGRDVTPPPAASANHGPSWRVTIAMCPEEPGDEDSTEL